MALLARRRWFVSISNPRKFYVSYFLGWLLVWACIIWLYCQILISCTIPNGSPFTPSCDKFCTSFVLVFALFSFSFFTITRSGRLADIIIIIIILSLETEWQQVSSSLQDTSQYSGWSQKNCSLECLHSSSSRFTNPLVTVPRAPITIDITVTYHYYNYYYYSLWDFHTSASWWSFTGVWVRPSLLKFPGVFSIFWQCYSLDGVRSCSDFQLYQSSNQTFGDRSERTNYD